MLCDTSTAIYIESYVAKIPKECLWNDFPPSQRVFSGGFHSKYLSCGPNTQKEVQYGNIVCNVVVSF